MKNSALKEVGQVVKRDVFYPIMVSDLTEDERQKAMESLIFVSEKRSGEKKSRFCANRSNGIPFTNREDAASPTAMEESVFIKGTKDAKQQRDVMTANIPNAFVQTDMKPATTGD